ncbi:MAG TPA: aminoglycoside phosphotransferase family protein, partial [Ktedonobacterales bacterium]|nr:aminoglycoside phosphotransferase family protein [Ktedonobacterales bacterium]
MREPLNISEDRLRACLQDQYGLSVISIEFLPLGLDTRAGVYRVASAQDTTYFLKVKSGSLYEPSCLVPRYLQDQGIVAVAAPLPTKEHTLWTVMGEWTLILYPYIEGETGWNPGMTDEQWQAVGLALRQIHQIGLPAEGFASLRKGTFDVTEYSQQILELETHVTGSQGGSQIEREFRSGWIIHQDTIHTTMALMEKLAVALQQRSGSYVICHADLHPSNIIRDQAGHVFVID